MNVLTPTEQLYFDSLVRIGRFGHHNALKVIDLPPDTGTMQLLYESPFEPRDGRITFVTGQSMAYSILNGTFSGEAAWGDGSFADEARIRKETMYYLTASTRMYLEGYAQRLSSRVAGHLPPYDEEEHYSKETWFARGLGHERGFGLVQYIAQAILCYTTAASLGCAEALYRLGFLLEFGEGEDSSNEPLAYEMYRKAAALGCTNAMAALGQRALFEGLPTKDPSAARLWLYTARQAGWKGDWGFLSMSGALDGDTKVLGVSDIAEQYKNALNVYESPVADILHWYDENDEANLRAAKFLHRKGYAIGTRFLAWHRVNGRFLSMNPPLAIDYARIAARDPDPDHLHFLVWVWTDSYHEKDSSALLDLLRKAADLGSIYAKEDLATLARTNRLDPETFFKIGHFPYPELHLGGYGYQDMDKRKRERKLMKNDQLTLSDGPEAQA